MLNKFIFKGIEQQEFLKHMKKEEKQNLVKFMVLETKMKGDIIFKKNALMGENLIFLYLGNLLKKSTKDVYEKQGNFCGVDNLFLQ